MAGAGGARHRAAFPRTLPRRQTGTDPAADIHARYAQRLTLEKIAACASISVSEALRCFHTGIQTTPVQYLNDYRLNRAADRLLTTADSITAVAAAAGFENAGYFCRVFKKRYGCTPGAFRRNGG
ncbi:helix-turn-helix domain-containing protein [Lawsonibacter celer]|uniref:helix-turn-helix domain-containing protein n=1 Tax=Lawsonibacter celer TaxID=2986526 RepID=UPI0016447069